MEREEIFPDLWVFRDICNVYVRKRGDQAIAVDFGTGAWMDSLSSLGIRRLTDVFLTHSHADQCSGLSGRESREFSVHAPSGERQFLDPGSTRIPQPSLRGFCGNYSILPGGIPGIRYDIAGFGDLFWGTERIRFLSTPGHTPGACTVILDHAGRQIAFCGDAVHEGGTIWQPYHLEWDHWTGTGVLAAWEGIQRLMDTGNDVLCPSHGPVVAEKPRRTLALLSGRLLKLYRAKGSICSGEPDDYVEPHVMGNRWRKILPRLYHFGSNGYLLCSERAEGLVVDPSTGDMPALEELLAEECRGIRPAVAFVTHPHSDHCSAVPALRERYRVRAWLHPKVARPLRDPSRSNFPYLPVFPIRPNGLLPEEGTWRWNEYEFSVAHAPGQTWNHAFFMSAVDRWKVLFSGDSFQPASRWNGTGGFCALNESRFREGFARSATLVMEWAPDIVAGGHGTCYRYHPSHFRKILRWAASAEKAVRDLCPSGDLERDYYSVLQR